MKKLLLGTTALVGAALVSQAALADSPKVTVGGYSDFQYGYVSESASAGERNSAFRSDNQISFKVDGKTDSGLGYGAEIWLEADTSATAQDRGVNASKTFLYVEGMWGRFEGGSNLGVDQTMKIDASTIARATGGIDGDWTYFATQRAQMGVAAIPAVVIGGVTVVPGTAATTAHGYIARPDLPLNYGASILGDESEENLNKITYYTPKWYGFQGGVSYVVDQTNRGQGSPVLSTNPSGGYIEGPDRMDELPGRSQDIFLGALNYSNTWDQINFGAAATGEWGEHDLVGYHNLRAWQGGAKVGYMGFSLAGSYGSWGDSNQAVGSGDDSHYWTLGGAYEFGPFGVSLTYLDSRYSNADDTTNRFNSWSAGADYKLAPGLTPYVEWTHFNEEDATVGDGNHGNVFLVGSSLNF